MRGERGLPLLAGVLLGLSFPPARLLLPVFVGLVPLLLFIAHQPPGPAGRWAAMRGGIITGVVYFGLQLYWIAVALIHHSILAVPAYLGIVLILAGLVGAFGWAVHYTRERLRLPLPLLAAVFWTGLEWVQAHLGDLAFPWLGLGTALAPFPALAGAADLAGARGLTFWIAGVNGLIASTLLLHRHRRPLTPAVLLLIVALAGPAAYGVVRFTTLGTEPVARVAVVQPNITEEVKLGPLGLDSSLTALTTLTRTLEGEALDLVAWPEIALPADFLRSAELRAVVHDLSQRIGSPILVGAYGVGGARYPEAYNSAFLVDGRAPRASAPPRYDKQRLVPFIERIPFVGPWLPAATGPFPDTESEVPGRRVALGTLSQGRQRPLLGQEKDAAFGVLICYESIFAPIARAQRGARADFLVNITNDAWYGRDSWWGRTTALWQHPAHMVMRAIETRTGAARAANTGISLFVDPLGRTHGRTPLFEPAVAVATVHTTAGTTLFVRWGDWVGTLAVLFALAALAAARFRAPSGHIPGVVDRAAWF